MTWGYSVSGYHLVLHLGNGHSAVGFQNVRKTEREEVQTESRVAKDLAGAVYLRQTARRTHVSTTNLCI